MKATLRVKSHCVLVTSLALAAIAIACSSVSVRAQSAGQKVPVGPPSGKAPAQGPAPANPTTGKADTGTSKVRGLIRTINEDMLVLSPGDSIQIQIENHPELDNHYVIPSVGKLLLPEIGLVEVAGKTIGQVGSLLQTEYEKTLNNVFVRVLLLEVHSRKAIVSGFVFKQGTIEMGLNEYRILDLLDMCGGFASSISRPIVTPADFDAFLYRGPAVIDVDLVELYKHPDGPANLIVQPNDRISIVLRPYVTHLVHILGKIPRQGAYTLDNNTSVLGLFGQAGYPDTSSALSKSYVLRGNQQIPLDLRPLLTGNADPAVKTFKFQDDDILYIPEVKSTYMVWGQVGRQGNFPYPEAGKVFLLDAINLAGQAPTGNYKQVHVLRQVDGKQQDTTVNVDQMIRKNLMKDNMLLQPNDIVWVGPRPKKPWSPTFQDIFLPLTLLNYLGLRPF